MTDTQRQNRRLALSRAAALALALAWFFAASFSGRAQSATASAVKAGFLYNFARFTEWPGDAFPSAAAPLVIGIAGDEFLRFELDNVIRGKVAGTRTLKTRSIKDPKDAVDIQMLYVAGRSADRASDFISAVRGVPVLTVGDLDRFCDKGGMINFLIADNRLRFEIGFEAIERSRLKLSSRVVTLATTIRGKHRP